MKRKIFTIVFLFFILTQVNALALNCDLSKFQLGKSVSNFEKEKEIFIPLEVLPGIKSLVIPIEFVCEKSGANGTFIALFFMDDKIIRIIFENVITKNKPLLKIANNIYKAGFKENQKIIDKNEPEQYTIEKNGIYYLYAHIKGINENKGNFFELFEIVDKKYENAATKELLKQEEEEKQ